ncbi:MAG TPA: RHS repeat-associated core domain-containing protein [Longimicrobium sp.]|nr:RHS repeat-associated core domain-containing protein [Longimicrobium sp.]
MAVHAEGTRCVAPDWAEGWFPYNPARPIPEHWHGSLLTEKRDGSGLLYRRNRYYDPSTSRFTQADPIGLAGGLNLYGFAAGDPVTHGDPYGLAPIPLIVIDIWAMRAAPYVAAAGRLVVEAAERGGGLLRPPAGRWTPPKRT